MARYGMLIDTRACIGCGTCRTACQSQNGLGPAESFIRFETVEHGAYPDVSVEFVPVQCMHCADAPCEAVCPSGATHFSEGGLVVVDQGRCIGCKYCMYACPYQARVVNEATGGVDKCRFCATATLQGTPTCTCVDACPVGARVFGDLDDASSELVRAIARTAARPLAADLTDASIYYAR